MNYTNRFISFTVLAAVLSSCGFNEDFCIRNGELVARCDFSGIRETPPVPEERHIIAFPSGMDIPSGEQMTFTQDTLRQSIPQGEYQFLFYTGNYEVSDIRDYHEARLMARTDTPEGEVYISGVQKFCCSAGFSQRPEYQRPKRVPIKPSAFVQRLNIRINVSGNITPRPACKVPSPVFPPAGTLSPGKGQETQVSQACSCVNRKPTGGRQACTLSGSTPQQRISFR
ncbi:hypothetical protein NXV14_14580 [Bacteroides fragilis]|nr:hypothetical protein [Bacteroides fragilis]